MNSIKLILFLSLMLQNSSYLFTSSNRGRVQKQTACEAIDKYSQKLLDAAEKKKPEVLEDFLKREATEYLKKMGFSGNPLNLLVNNLCKNKKFREEKEKFFNQNIVPAIQMQEDILKSLFVDDSNKKNETDPQSATATAISEKEIIRRNNALIQAEKQQKKDSNTSTAPSRFLSQLTKEQSRNLFELAAIKNFCLVTEKTDGN